MPHGWKAAEKSLLNLWKSIIRWRIGGRWYLIALVITLLLASIPVAIFALAGGYSSSAFTFSNILFVFVMQIFTSGLGEEPGWRGKLLPRLKARFSGDNYVWVLGLIWAIWHYPLVILQTLSMVRDATTLQMTITIITSLAGMTMSQIGITYIYTWLFNQTESVLLMILFHTLSNTLSNWLMSFLEQPQAVTIFVALMSWVIVLVLQKIIGKEVFPGR